MKAAVAVIDEGGGPPVLLLHGQPGSAADWAGVRIPLRRTFRVLVPDRPGYGNTGGRALGMAGNAEAMVALLDDLEIPSAVVAGHSWGAGAALALAEGWSDRVNRLVLICPVTPADRLGALDRLLASRVLGAASTRAAFWAAGLALSNGRVQRQLARSLPGFPSENSVDLARAWRRGTLWRSFHREQRALFDELPSLRDGLSRLAAPTTVVAGSNDRITPARASREFALSVGATFIEVPRGGHMLPMQAPAEVAKAIAEG